MAWELQSQVPLQASPVESFQIVPVAIVSDALAYGFRVNIGATLPPTWQRLGFWMWMQEAGGFWFHSEAHDIPNLFVNGIRPIALIGANQVDVIAFPGSNFALGLSLQRWVPRDSVSVLVLRP